MTGTDDHDDLETLVGAWMPLPDVAEQLDLPFGKVRRLVDERSLVGVRRTVRAGEQKVYCVPEVFVVPDLLESLGGTLSVLADAGYSDTEALRWLFTPDESLGSTPVEQLRAGHKTEIRRRAQALAL